jgi:hypothetical protein
MKIISSVLIVTALLITGCHHEPSPGGCENTIYKKTKCPRFDYKLSIYVDELNSTHAAIKWSDVSKIESCIKRKKEFNRKVDGLNK